MKTIVMIYSGDASAYAVEKSFGGLSATRRSLYLSSQVSDCNKLVIFTDSHSRDLCVLDEILKDEFFATVPFPVEIVESEKWTYASLTSAMSKAAESYNTVVYGWYDCPFYDETLVKQLCKAHTDYFSEYTFADGYPVGLAPEVIDSGALRIITELAKENTTPVDREMLFNIMKKDINSFDVETIIAPVDMRLYRLSFTCSTKRDALLCHRLYKKALLSEGTEKRFSTEQLCNIAVNEPSILRTLPAFYNIQVSSACSGKCTFCAWPQMCKNVYDCSPDELLEDDNTDQKTVNGHRVFMSFDDFKSLVKKIQNFSDDAVIALSLWGEPLSHPQFTQVVKEVLSYPSLSLLIETDGMLITEEMVLEVSEIVKHSPARTTNSKSVNWIVAVDATDDVMYKQLHGKVASMSKAVDAVKLLKNSFVGCVYPQFVRLQENEDQLESFYRYWKADGNGELIVQKYDDLSDLLSDKKVADLTPIVRNPCWHLRRDMCITVEGNVVLCRSAMANEMSPTMGNALSEDLKKIWDAGNDFFAAHLKTLYSPICRKCDEYYTFNF